MQEKIKIRDLRKSEQYKLDDAYLNGYARLCGVYATAVYNSLSRHADFNTQQCWPSIKLLCEQHNISNKSVIKGIKELEKWGIIKIEKEKDPKSQRQLPNVYWLIDKSEWKPKPRVNDVHMESRVNVRTEPCVSQGESRVNDVHCKDTQFKDNTIEGVAILQIADNINHLIELFEPINPTFERFYKNKTERQSLTNLVKKFGDEKVSDMIKALPEIISKPYAPKITTPYELEKNLGKLVIFVKQNKSNAKKIKAI